MTNLSDPATFSVYVEREHGMVWKGAGHVSGCSLTYCLAFPGTVVGSQRLIANIYDDTEGHTAQPVLYGERREGERAIVWTTEKPARRDYAAEREAGGYSSSLRIGGSGS